MVDIVELEPQIVVGVRESVPETELGDFFPRAFAAAAAAAGPLIVGPPVAIYYGDPSGGVFDVLTGFPVSADPQADGVTVEHLPGGKAARVVHVGPYNQLGQAYGQLSAALAERGVAWTVAWEQYLVMPPEAASDDDLVTHVFAPLG